jgi:hypothetical protein
LRRIVIAILIFVMTRHFTFDSKDFEDISLTVLLAKTHEDLAAWALRQYDLTRVLINRLCLDSSTSSMPPSSDNPFGKNAKDAPVLDAGSASSTTPEKAAKAVEPTGTRTGRKPGKKAGEKGFWRVQPVVPTGEVRHPPTVCTCCGAAIDPDQEMRCVGAHNSLELERGFFFMQVTATRHSYFAATCPCGHETVAQPGVGAKSEVEGRKKNLQLTERCLVGPMFAVFIANLSVRFRMSRKKIQEFLFDWFGLELGVATIERCIHEFGLASEPVVEQFLQEIRTSAVVHVDETPWYQKGDFRWMWVATTAVTTVFMIGSRRKDEIVKLLGEAFVGWLVTDGYLAYRGHARRQRCLAHLIRKGLELAKGLYGAADSEFGRSLVFELRRLIQRIHDGEDGEAASVKRLVARMKWNCQRHRFADEKKVRDLAGEILNDWDAVVAFVHDPTLPPTNNEAERALRHAVISRRISFGTRTDEGSRFYAAALSLIETCRKRGADAVDFAARLIAAARSGAPPPAFPTSAAA